MLHFQNLLEEKSKVRPLSLGDEKSRGGSPVRLSYPPAPLAGQSPTRWEGTGERIGERAGGRDEESGGLRREEKERTEEGRRGSVGADTSNAVNGREMEMKVELEREKERIRAESRAKESLLEVRVKEQEEALRTKVAEFDEKCALLHAMEERIREREKKVDSRLGSEALQANVLNELRDAVDDSEEKCNALSVRCNEAEETFRVERKGLKSQLAAMLLEMSQLKKDAAFVEEEREVERQKWEDKDRERERVRERRERERVREAEREMQQQEGGRVKELLSEKKYVEDSYERKIQDQAEVFRQAQAEVRVHDCDTSSCIYTDRYIHFFTHLTASHCVTLHCTALHRTTLHLTTLY